MSARYELFDLLEEEALAFLGFGEDGGALGSLAFLAFFTGGAMYILPTRVRET